MSSFASLDLAPHTGRWLYGHGTSVALLIDLAPGEGLLPQIVHFGASLGAQPDFETIAGMMAQPLWGARLDVPRAPCVLPGLEGGWFGTPAISPITHGVFIFSGAASGLSGDVFEATLSFESRGGPARLMLDYRLMRGSGILSSRLRVEDADSHLTRAASLALPLPAWITQTITYGGDWAREMAPERSTLGSHGFFHSSRRGRPGHDRFPGIVLGETGFGPLHGRAYQVTLGWSGGHEIIAERMREGPVLIQAGAMMPDGDDTGMSFEGPWAYAAYSDQGTDDLARRMQNFVRAEILPGTAHAKPRLVHLNTWEALYLSHEETALKDLASRAAVLGVERFVLDDGWFKGRAHDRSGLGDWIPDRSKYPDGLGPLIDHVTGQGMEFGLWVEPEMVNPDSDLARAHPDWLRREADGSLILQRHQAVLDLTIPSVPDHLFATLRSLLTLYPISYLKWDMNRDLTGLDQTGKPGHAAYTRALYALIDRVREAHPLIEIEACASGGGRMDFGILSRAERVWLSDSNDALDRFDIQAQALQFLPLNVLGSHVGPAACHITGRRLNLDLRAHVAMFGHMGLELDVRALSAAEGERLAAHIAQYKRYRHLLHSGFARAIDTRHPDYRAIAAEGADGAVLVLVIRSGSARLGQGCSLFIPGLDPRRRYRVSVLDPVSPSAEPCLSPQLLGEGAEHGGMALCARGIEIFLPRPETSLVLLLQTAG